MTHVTIDNEQFFKTGDLAQYNTGGELVYNGRVDFQIEINGQRVEAAEIEMTILAWSLNEISNCLVVKCFQDDKNSIVAYIISHNLQLDIESLRNYCGDHLRQYMIPSYFIILDNFPLNTNGKVDRKQLPLPSVAGKVPTQLIQADEGPLSELEERVHDLWCTMLHLDAVSRYANYFALGGASLSLVQLFNYYQFYLTPDKQLNVSDFFFNATIADHVRRLISSETKTTNIWSPLHLTQGT